MWTKYSFLKSTLIVNDNLDISRYNRLVSFLKQNSKGYVPKKSKVLTGDQVLTFMKHAPNETYLMHKVKSLDVRVFAANFYVNTSLQVVLIMGVFGALRRDEMVKMTIDDIQDKGCVILVKVPETKTGEAKGFTIVEEEEIGALKLVRQYVALRPMALRQRRFFLTYRNSCCTGQPVGKNTIGSVPSIIARYLKLDNAKEYTGHCMRRTSSTLLVEAGATFETLKMHGKWKSTTVAEGYIAESMASKNRIARMIASSVGTSVEDKVELSSSEGTIVNITGELSSSVCESQEGIASSSKDCPVYSASFSGSFQNCQFFIGKDVNK